MEAERVNPFDEVTTGNPSVFIPVPLVQPGEHLRPGGVLPLFDLTLLLLHDLGKGDQLQQGFRRLPPWDQLSGSSLGRWQAEHNRTLCSN